MSLVRYGGTLCGHSKGKLLRIHSGRPSDDLVLRYGYLNSEFVGPKKGSEILKKNQYEHCIRDVYTWCIIQALGQ